MASSKSATDASGEMTCEVRDRFVADLIVLTHARPRIFLLLYLLAWCIYASFRVWSRPIVRVVARPRSHRACIRISALIAASIQLLARQGDEKKSRRAVQQRGQRPLFLTRQYGVTCVVIPVQESEPGCPSRWPEPVFQQPRGSNALVVCSTTCSTTMSCPHTTCPHDP